MLADDAVDAAAEDRRLDACAGAGIQIDIARIQPEILYHF